MIRTFSKISLVLLLLNTGFCISCNSGFPDCESDASIYAIKKAIAEKLSPNASGDEKSTLIGSIKLSSFDETGLDDGGLTSDNWTCFCSVEYDYKKKWGTVQYSINRLKGNLSMKVNNTSAGYRASREALAEFNDMLDAEEPYEPEPQGIINRDSINADLTLEYIVFETKSTGLFSTNSSKKPKINYAYLLETGDSSRYTLSHFDQLNYPDEIYDLKSVPSNPYIHLFEFRKGDQLVLMFTIMQHPYHERYYVNKKIIISNADNFESIKKTCCLNDFNEETTCLELKSTSDTVDNKYWRYIDRYQYLEIEDLDVHIKCTQ